METVLEIGNTMSKKISLDDLDYALTYITKQAEKLNSFPINNLVNTKASNESFSKIASILPVDAQEVAAKNINRACIEFGIEPSETIKAASNNCPPQIITNLYVETNEESMANKRIKVASPTQSKYYYALVKEAGDGSTNAKYAMPTPEYVKVASDYFDKHCDSFSVGDRHKYASNVLKRSAELSLDVTSGNILKYAGVSFNSNIGDAILLRKTLLEDGSTLAPAFDKLASYQGSTDPETFANVLFELDKKAGLDRFYGKYLPDPYISTFSTGVQKTASVIYSDKDGRTIDSDQFKIIAASKYKLLKQYFGHTLADGLKKDGAIAFQALPDDTKAIIARIANGEIK